MPNLAMKYTLPTPYGVDFKILKVMVLMTRSNVKSMSHHDTAHLHPQPMYLPCIDFLTQYGFRDIVKILRSRLNQGHTKTLQTYIPN